MEFKQFAKISSIILFIGTIIILIFGALAWSRNVYAAYVYLIIGLIQFLVFVLIFLRIMKETNLLNIGNNIILLCWVMLSLALAGMTLILAPFFALEPKFIPYVVFTIYIIQVGLSIYTMYEAVKKANARLII